jgi:hypothetical protein
MAPDLNSVPPSPHPSTTSATSPLPRVPSSRRASQQMASPQILPLSPALNILPSNQSTVNNIAPPMVSPPLTGTMSTASSLPGDNTGVGTGPGPLRHPRPLTAADLHLQLEKEQEAVVSSDLLHRSYGLTKYSTGKSTDTRAFTPPRRSERFCCLKLFVNISRLP